MAVCIWFALAGATLGLGLYTYNIYPIFVVAFTVWVILYTLLNKRGDAFKPWAVERGARGGHCLPLRATVIRLHPDAFKRLFRPLQPVLRPVLGASVAGLIPHRYPKGEYLLVYDPIDGSSNIDVNLSVGTIFSVLEAPEGASTRDVRRRISFRPAVDRLPRAMRSTVPRRRSS